VVAFTGTEVLDSSVGDTGAVPVPHDECTVEVPLPYGGVLDGAADEESEAAVDSGMEAVDGGADDSSTGKLVRVPSVKVEAEVLALGPGLLVHQIRPELFRAQEVTNGVLVLALGVMVITLVKTTVLVVLAGLEGTRVVLFEGPVESGMLVGVEVPVPENEVRGGRVISSSVLVGIGG
jgi:hypothetical protein